jgi:hypothetical protein
VIGVSNPNQQLLMGYNTTSDFGYIQAIIQSTGARTLKLNPYAGAVTTMNNTLDDGTGLMYINSTSANALTCNATSGNTVQIGLQLASAALAYFRYDTTNGVNILNGSAGVILKQASGSGSGVSLLSHNNILDDGSGNMTAVNFLGINGVTAGEVGGNPANAKNITMSYDLGNDWGVIEAIHQNSSYRPIHISPNGGAIVCGGALSAVGNITAPNLPLLATGTLSSAQLLAITTPVTLIAAAGAGNAIVLTSISWSYNYVSTTYASGGPFRILYNNNTSYVAWKTSGGVSNTITQPNSTFNVYGDNISEALDPSFVSNLPVTVSCASNFTTGGGNIKYTISYRIISL